MAKLKSQSQKYVELKEEDYLLLIENTIKMEALKIAGINRLSHIPKSKPILNVERVSHLRSGFVLRILPIVTVGAPLMDTIPFSFTVLSVV
jgi:hypothetical protein